jgi:dTMP kinase
MYLGGEFGSANSMTPKQASALYAVDRLCTYKKDFEQFYKDGGIIVLDRYVQSNMLHQAGKIEDKAEVEEYLDWLDKLEFIDLGLPRANKVIFLDMPVSASRRLMLERGIYKTGTKKDVHEEDPEHMIKAYNSGKFVSKKFNWTVIPCVDEKENIKSIEEISDLVFDSVIQDLK